MLAQGERHVDELAGEIDQSVANTSFHLRALAAAGLVTTRRDGTRIYYRLASDRVGELWAALRDVAAAHHERLDELAAAYLGDRGRPRADRPRRARPTASPTATSSSIDVRPEPPSTPPDTSPAPARSRSTELAASIKDLPADVEVVAYCRGPYCVFADDAVRLLRRRGRRARRLEDGFPEWQRADLPVTVAAAS